MGEIIESRRRHYVGLDADKDTIPAGGKAKGDSYHANDKGKQYYWDGTNWKTGLGYEYVVRDVAAFDFDQTDFPVGDAIQQNGLDLTGIIPVGTVAVHMDISIRDAAVNEAITLYCNQTTRALNRIFVKTQVANIYNYNNIIIAVDSDRLLDYYVDAGIDSIQIAVVGYFI